ncbi:MAG: CBS domain-containing protein [Deltaproteobacteria bacterium]|nr:CBS domain-containing protein [Deltaproteobacteria bacterium]
MTHKIVREYMASEPTTLQETDTLRAAVECVLVRKIRHLPVVDEEGQLVGIFTDRDLKRSLPSPLSGLEAEDREQLLDETTIQRLMTREPVTISPDANLADAVEQMIERKIGGIPVVEHGRLVGIITQTDALRALLGLLD